MSHGVVFPEFIGLADTVIRELRAAQTSNDLFLLMEGITREMGCRHFALAHHDDLRLARSDRVNLYDYPQMVVDRLFSNGRYRRDPVIRASPFAGGAFLWTDLQQFIHVTRSDRQSLEFGAKEGLNQGVTVPYFRLGDCVGSCTFAGMDRPEDACRLLGAAQIIGTFAFQAALRLLAAHRSLAPPPRLHPRPRDCVALAGQGLSNKQIARALALAPRTVDGYLTDARRLFDVHDRTELVTAAVVAGEVGIDEIARRQPG